MKRYNTVMGKTDDRNKPRNPRQVANMKYNEKKKDPELAKSGTAGQQGQNVHNKVVFGGNYVQKYAITDEHRNPFAIVGDSKVQELAGILCSTAAKSPRTLAFDRHT